MKLSFPFFKSADNSSKQLDVRDYPKAIYYAYWEILFLGEGGYIVRFYNYDTSELIEEFTGSKNSDLDARIEARELVRRRMSTFKR